MMQNIEIEDLSQHVRKAQDEMFLRYVTRQLFRKFWSDQFIS